MYYLGVMIICIVSGVCQNPGAAFASMPSALSASANRTAAPEPGSASDLLRSNRSSTCPTSLVSTRNWISTPVVNKGIPAVSPCSIVISQPAMRRGGVSTLANDSVSGVDGETLTCPDCFGALASDFERADCCSAVSILGASLAWSFKFSPRSASADSFARAASALAFSARSSVCAIVLAASDLYCSSSDFACSFSCRVSVTTAAVVTTTATR